MTHLAKRTSSQFEQVLRRMSPEIATSFTPDQLAELQRVMRNSYSKHPIDIRLTIPFPKRGFYFVLFAGRERRSIERLRAENPHYVYTAVLGLFVALGSLTALTVPSVLWIMSWNAKSQYAEIHPTAIPWLQDQQSCEKTGREWQDDHCWEEEWSHNF